MRIDDLNRTPVPPGPGSTEASAASGETTRQRATQQDAIAGSDQPDQAAVSQLAQSLAGADPGRIEELRLQVQSGSYEVSAQATANSLIDAHLKL
jgi:flagellar biosynthesis anti-sigma factor FlgM